MALSLVVVISIIWFSAGNSSMRADWLSSVALTDSDQMPFWSFVALPSSSHAAAESLSFRQNMMRESTYILNFSRKAGCASAGSKSSLR